ncbi:MAG TPA: 50S ribosomal protein L25 [Candidatus Limnocylindrales bacterium]|nr:50S ribosomal protein L25 [Candidatus Limnocylindrales bacterium]
MDMQNLTIEKREGTGKGPARRLRRAGRVPAVLYGTTTPLNVAVNPQDVYRLLHGHEGSTRLLQVTFKGEENGRMAIIRDMQFDPVSENLIHVDLQEVAMDKPIQVAVPIRHVGEAIGVKDSAGILEMILREVQVSCLPRAIPEVIIAEVSGLGIHDVLTVKDLEVPEGVRILNDPNQAVVTVAPPAAEEAVAAVAPVAAEGAAAAEPEVLTDRKPKEEAEEKKK